MTDPTAETLEASRLIQRAVKLGADDAFVLGLSGFATFYVLGDVEGGAAYLERARWLNPNLALLWGGSGLINVYLGLPDLGIEQILHAMRLSPFDHSMGFWQQAIALGHFCADRDDDTVLWATNSLRDWGYNRNTLILLAASYATQGHTDEAQKAVARLRSVDPSSSLSNLPELELFRRAKDRERLVEGLRLAGLPE
jgi:tetratricopeptide (TPR) repeat protein